MNIKNSRWRIVALSAVAVGAVAFGGTTAASAESYGQPADPSAESDSIAIDLLAPGESTDARGEPLTILSEDVQVGEAIYAGVKADGEPYRLTVQSALPESNLPVQTRRVGDSALEAAKEAPGLVPDELLPAYTDGPVDSGEQYAVLDPTLDDSQLTPVFGFAVTPDAVSFSWVPVDGAVAYRVSKDDEVLETTHEIEAQYGGLEEGERYAFQIDSLDSEGAVLSTRTVPILAASDHLTEVAARTFQPYNLALTYKTFIPGARVSLGLLETLGCGFAGATDNPQFGGDNRSWSLPTAAAPSEPAHWRTMMFANINWQNPPEYSVIYRTNIGTTHLYRNGVLSEQRTATGSITPSDAYRSGSYAQIHFAHSVGNPFCVAGAITYDATFRFYQSGTIEVAGSRYPVPNHEIYGRWNPSGYETWYPMMQAVNEGFICLTGYCTNPGISLSVTR